MNPIYAIDRDTGELLHISEVLNGKNCNCICPTCEEDLIAKNNGKLNIHHFAHKHNTNCSSLETYLHFLTKLVFNEIKYLHVPAVRSSIHLSDDELGMPFNTKNYELGGFYPIKNVRIEKSLGGIIPDIAATLTIDGKDFDFLIEIAVTHFVEKEKIAHIKASGLNCIEINLSDLKDGAWDKSLAKKALLETTRWRIINQVVVDVTDIDLQVRIDFLNRQNKIEGNLRKLKQKIINNTITLPGYSYKLAYDGQERIVKRDSFDFHVARIKDSFMSSAVFTVENENDEKIIIALKSNYDHRAILDSLGRIDLIMFLCKKPELINENIFTQGYYKWRFLNGYHKAKWSLYNLLKNKPTVKFWNSQFRL